MKTDVPKLKPLSPRQAFYQQCRFLETIQDERYKKIAYEVLKSFFEQVWGKGGTLGTRHRRSLARAIEVNKMEERVRL